jgi:hypothetical protein
MHRTVSHCKIRIVLRLKNLVNSQAQWLITVNPVLGRWRKGELGFEANPGKKLARPPHLNKQAGYRDVYL